MRCPSWPTCRWRSSATNCSTASCPAAPTTTSPFSSSGATPGTPSRRPECRGGPLAAALPGPTVEGRPDLVDERRGCGADGLGVDCAGMALRHHPRVPTLRIAQDDAADDLLGRDPLALLLGMMLDQHVSEEQWGRSEARLGRAHRGVCMAARRPG